MQLLHHLADPLGDFIPTIIGIGILVVNKDLPHPCGSEIVIIIIIIIIIMSATCATKHFHSTSCDGDFI